MAHSTFAKVSAAVIIALIFLMMGSCLIPLAHGATTRPRPNSLGLSQSYQNPMTYMFGTIDHVDFLSNASIVTFRPFGASMLDTEPILFCGDLTDQLEGGTNQTLYVFTYRLQGSRTYHGIACHEVYRILTLGESK